MFWSWSFLESYNASFYWLQESILRILVVGFSLLRGFPRIIFVFYCICDRLSFSDPITISIGLSNCNCVTRKFKIPTVNIALNGLSRSREAFAASMNTRKEFPTLEELWTCAQEEIRLNSKGKPQKEEDAQAFTTKFKRHGGKKRSDSRKKFKRDMSKVQCFECHDYGPYKRNCLKLARKRKARHHASTTNYEEETVLRHMLKQC
jgi:hypothetical protein